MDLGWLAAIVVGLIAAWLVLLAVVWIARPRGVPVGELLRLAPDTIRLIRALIGDGAVPLDVRAVMIGLLVWLLSPIDLIPEFVPVIGPLDDIVIAIAAMRYARRRLGIEALHRRWTGSEAGFGMLARILGTRAG